MSVNEEVINREESPSTENEDKPVTELTQESILKKIFSTCDPQNTGFVSVSQLIAFISPYLNSNAIHLKELSNILDPNKCDPSIDSNIFSKAIKDWTDLQSQCTLTDNTQEMNEKESCSFVRQSTPARDSIGKTVLREFEEGALNLSDISGYSLGGSTTGGLDPVLLQEQINELEFQNKKQNEMLLDIGAQMISSEEQNNLLQSEVEKLTKKLQSEQKIIEHLQKERNEIYEQRENTNSVIKQNEVLHHELTASRKDITQLKSTINEFEIESERYLENITELRKKEQIILKKLEELQIEAQSKETDILALKEKTNELNELCREKDVIIKQLHDETENLHDEKRSTEKRLNEVLERNSSLMQQLKENSRNYDKNTECGNNSQSKQTPKCVQSFNFSTPIEILRSNLDFSRSESPIPRILDRRKSFNNPKLLKMINNPVSPLCTDSPNSVNSIEFQTGQNNKCHSFKIVDLATNSESDTEQSACKQKQLNLLNKNIIQETEDAVQILGKDNLEISVNLGDDHNIICSIQTQSKIEKKSSDKNQISPSKLEQATQTLFENDLKNIKADINLAENLSKYNSFESHNRDIRNICEADVPVSNSSDSIFYSILDSQINPDKSLSKSCTPNSSDDESYWKHLSDKQMQNPSGSLHSELINESASAGDSKFISICNHDFEIVQYQYRIQALLYEIEEHKNCEEAVNNYKQKQIDLELLLEKDKVIIDNLEAEIKITNQEIKSQQTTLQEQQLINVNTQTALDDAKNKITALEKQCHSIENLRENYETKIQQLQEFEMKLKTENENKCKEITDLKESLNLYKIEIDKYKREIRDNELQQDLLEFELDKAKQSFSEASDQCRVLLNNNETLNCHLQEKEDEKQKLINDNKELLKEICIKKDAYRELKNMLQKKDTELSNLREELEHLNQNYMNSKTLLEVHERLKKDLEEHNIHYKSVQEQLNLFKKENEVLKQDSEAKLSQIEKLQNEFETVRKQSTDHDELLKKHNSLLIAKSTLEHNLEDYKSKYEKSFSQLSQLKLNCGIAETKLRDREKEMKNAETELTKIYSWLEESKENFEQERHQWKNSENEFKDKINSLEQEIENHRSMSYTLTCTNCEKVQAELFDLKLIHDNLKIKFKDLETEARPSAKPVIKKGTRVELLHHKIEKLEEQLDEEKNKMKSLMSSLKKISTEKTELETKFSVNDKEKQEILLQRDNCQTRIKKLSHNVEALELKMQNYRQTICELNEQVISRNKEIVTINNKSIEYEERFSTVNLKYGELIKYINSVLKVLKERREALGSHTLYTVRVWKSTLENISPDSPILNLINTKISVNLQDDAKPLDEEMHLLEAQIRFTNILLKTLAKAKNELFDTPRLKQSRSSLSDDGVSGPSSADVNNRSLLETVVNNRFVLKEAKFLLNQSSARLASMSPDSPAAEMAEVSSHFSAMKILSSAEIELNNNISASDLDLAGGTQVGDTDSNMTQKHAEEDAGSKVFVSNRSESGSSSDTGSTESLGIELVARPSEDNSRMTAGGSKVENEKSVQEGLARQFRSLSEGAVVTHQLTSAGDVNVFPNLRDNVLDAMGLLPDSERRYASTSIAGLGSQTALRSCRERLTEEEVEAKFQTLTLAFAIDAVTLADRRERQRRQRDQAEDNLATEVARLVQTVHRLNPLCVDVETTELVTGLLNQLDVIVQASSRISTSAEVFGSVQQEWRLAESVNLMLSHLRNLRQQRDMARRQLQCTKRMLQESTSTTEASAQVNRQRPLQGNGRAVTRRRASIATLPRPLDSPRITGFPGTVTALVDGVTRRITTRRTSAAVCGEYSSRHWDSKNRPDWSPIDRQTTLIRPARPSRLELGRDLTKINEGSCESSVNNNCEIHASDTENCDFETPTAFSENEIVQQEIYVHEEITIRERVARCFRRLGQIVECWWYQLAEAGTVHEFCCLGAIICFALCTIIIGNLMLEMEYARRGIRVQRIPWYWMTWDELINLFVSVEHEGQPPT